MGNARTDFETAILVERVAERTKQASMQLSDKELIALGILVTLIPAARAKYLREHGIEYSPADETIASLIQKGLVKVQGKAITPLKDKAKAEMANHKRPAGAREWPVSFGPSKSKAELLHEKMRSDQEAWDRTFGRR